MPLTIRADLPYPAGSDAPDVPAALQALAEAVESYLPRVVYKEFTETVTSSTTLQDDNELFVGLQPGTYNVRAVLRAAGATGGDVKVAWTFDGTLTRSNRACWGPALSVSDAAATNMRAATASLGTGIGYGVDGTAGSAILEDLLLTVTVGGTLQLQWAQQASSGTATELTSECRMYVQKITTP